MQKQTMVYVIKQGVKTMNIRRTIKILSIAGAGVAMGAVILPGTATSATPGFAAWSSSGGTISGCPSGFSCTELVGGDGFRQVQVNDNNSADSFVWTIVTDTGATGSASTLPFSDENFVKTDGTSTGIADAQTVNDTTNGTFGGNVQILTGFASGGNDTVNIQQSLTADPNGIPGTGDEFANTFNMTVNLNSAGNQTGRFMKIDQSTALGNATDTQIFAIRASAGSALTTTSSMTLGGTAVSWNAGDDVLLTWVGQGLTLGSLGSSQFGFQGITNNTSSATASQFSQATAGPFTWDTGTFGTQPSFP
jgi:hypothetical protein